MDGPRTRKVMKRAKRVSLADSGRAARSRKVMKRAKRVSLTDSGRAAN